jgi:hypothetical protein
MDTPPEKEDIALKRVEQIKKEMDTKLETSFKELNSLIKTLFHLIYDTRQTSAQSIKDSTLTRYFLSEKGIINNQEYVDYFRSSPIGQNFNQEILIYQEILNDIASDEYKNPKNLSFMETKKHFREIELTQISVNRMKMMIKRLEKLSGQKDRIEELKKAVDISEKAIKKLFDEKIKSEKKWENQTITKLEDASKIINDYFSNNMNEFIERYRYLPINDITTHLEPYIKQLYAEAKQLYWLGRYNACIIICCVILEALLKDIIKIKEKKPSIEWEFDVVINHCRAKEYIDEKDKIWLIYVKDRFRNPYLHANLEKILPLIMVPGVAIGTDNPTVQMITTKTIPTLRDIVKPDLDKEQSILLFKETHNFIKKISEKHFDFSKVE